MELRCQIKFLKIWIFGGSNLWICPYFDQGASVLKIKRSIEVTSSYQIVGILIQIFFCHSLGELNFSTF